MEYSEIAALLGTAFAKNGLTSPTEEQAKAFYRFTEYLMAVNQQTNLTAIRSIPDVIYKHYVDSLLASQYIPYNSRVLDLGCGPGFPSIPLAIMRPDLSITALDSTSKKIVFVKQSKELLNLSNLQAISGRAEDSSIRKKLGEFDVVVSRAVARLNVLCELCIPYLKVDGKLIALKGAKAAEELTEAAVAIKVLNSSALGIHEIVLQTDEESEFRGLIEVIKNASTPKQYPRAYAAILKKPL